MSELQVFDKAKWHFEGNEYPSGMPEANAYTHGGFYLAWLIKRDLLSQEFLADFGTDVDRYREGEISSARLLEIADGVLDSNMMTEAAGNFTEYYYEDLFWDDYEILFEDDYDCLYAVEVTPDNQQQVLAMIDDTFQEWLEDEEL